MPRMMRTTYSNAWQSQADFNEQLYLALRQSPWWMISIATHVIAFVIAGLLHTAAPLPPEEPQLAIQNNMKADESEIEDPEEPIEVVDVPPPDVKPVIKEADIDDRVRKDVDLPFDEDWGEDGIGDASFNGPSTNGLIGLGGGAGASWGNGRGSNRDTTVGRQRLMRTAVEDALKWLAAHQSPNGGWGAAGFHRWCDGRPATGPGPDGAGYAQYDAGVTGLALCAFLGAGYTHRGRNPFAKTVAKGLRYLKNIQDPEGCFGPRSAHYMYNHACAALAMVEAYGMTESKVLRESAQKALNFIALARNPYFVWRYDVKPGDNDTSVTGWMMMALKSAKMINEDSIERGRPALLSIDEEAFGGIRAWMDKMTDPDTGRAGYIRRGEGTARPQDLLDKFPSEKSEAMTAVAVLARIFTGEDPRRSSIIKKGAELCAALPPVWDETDGSIDMYYWYYATLAMFQVGGAPWKTWNTHLKTGIVDHQRQDTDYCLYKGSWDPVGAWGRPGGRVYSTALLAMCLEVYYRYDNVFGTGGS